MKSYQKKGVAKAILAISFVAMAGTSGAAITVGGGGGFYGTAEFKNGQSIIVGAYSSYYECNQKLQSAIAYRVNTKNWTLDEVNACSFTPPFTPGVSGGEVGLALSIAGVAVEDNGDGGLRDALSVLNRVTELRQKYDIDAYEAELYRIR